MELLTCPYRDCKHQFTDNKVKFERTKYGKACLCPKCGMPIQVTKKATLSESLPRMSKKERRKAKAAVREVLSKVKK